MSSKDKTFRVLIAGGGVAGLTLATMFEKFDIDYLLLEAHGNIAPQVGASIGMFPNGLRILDQIDRYEPLQQYMYPDRETSYVNDENADPKAVIHVFQQHFMSRHGYPLMFFDRQMLLQSLYDQLRQKDKVLLNQRVAQIEPTNGGIEVTTKQGERFQGSMIIGADGVHSAVRQEMYRIGNKQEPGYFSPDEQDRVPCYYLCSFGIAQNVPGWKPGDQCNVLGKGHSQLVVSGPDRRTYWFFFSRLPETKYGKDIPTCTKEMEQEFVKKYANAPITKKVTFGQVYAHRISSTLTPLHEYVCEKWFYNRMIIFGDSAHKPNPIGGQGGNNAIESAAELVNVLLKKKDMRPKGLDGLTDQDIREVFTEVQAIRHDRAERIVFASHMQQALMAYEKPFMSKLVWGILTPLQGNESALSMIAVGLMRANRLKALPIKRRTRHILYHDELPAKPLQRTLPTKLIFAALMVYIFTKVYKTSPSSHSRLDGFFNQLTTFPSAGIEGLDIPIFPTLYSTLQLITATAIYVLEGYRIGHVGTFLGLPTMFSIAILVWGIERIAPIYALLHAFLSFDFPTGRFVEPSVVTNLGIALPLGFGWPLLVSVAFAMVQSSNRASWHTVIAGGQLAPVVVCVLTHIFTLVSRRRKRSSMSEKEKEDSDLDRYKGHDVSILKTFYSRLFFVQAAIHVLLVFYPFPSHREHLTAMFFGPLNYLIIPSAPWLLSNLYSIWKLRSLGYIKTQDAFVSALGVLVGQVMVGPGATWVALWRWREGALAASKM